MSPYSTAFYQRWQRRMKHVQISHPFRSHRPTITTTKPSAELRQGEPTFEVKLCSLLRSSDDPAFRRSVGVFMSLVLPVKFFERPVLEVARTIRRFAGEA